MLKSLKRKGPLAMTYFSVVKPDYHWRWDVSRLSSEWYQVGPSRYNHQGKTENKRRKKENNLGATEQIER